MVVTNSLEQLNFVSFLDEVMDSLSIQRHLIPSDILHICLVIWPIQKKKRFEIYYSHNVHFHTSLCFVPYVQGASSLYKPFIEEIIIQHENVNFYELFHQSGILIGSSVLI